MFTFADYFPLQSQDESEDERLLRIVLPDGSTSVLQAKPTDSLRSLLATLLSKKSDLSIAAIDVFPLNSDKVRPKLILYALQSLCLLQLLVHLHMNELVNI